VPRRRWSTSVRAAVALLAWCVAAIPTVASEAAASGAAESQTVPASSTVWLCRPGMTNDPCEAPSASTAVLADGTTKVNSTTASPASSKFDCFYVYPTVSTQRKDNANLKVQPAEVGAAVAQASRFSQVCRVWAPIYRQRTEASLGQGLGADPAADDVAYASLLSGWKDYLAHDNDGRPVIFIGHSQGSAMLIRLLQDQIDPHAALRKLMVSAIIAGGNVQVAVGMDVGGSFAHIPLCGSPRSTGCVIAYSSYGSEPPATANFGRPGQGVSLQSGQPTSQDQAVACVNPVNFSRAPGSLLPYFLTATQGLTGVKVATPWVSFPSLYTSQCENKGGATWLQVSPISVSGDPRPLVTASLGPDWGYHLDDINLALGDLVQDVAREEAAYHR